MRQEIQNINTIIGNHLNAGQLDSTDVSHVLNSSINDGLYAGCSVALTLAISPEGCALLAADNNRLAGLINEASLNAVIPAGPYAGLSLASALDRSPEGHSLLAANGNRLARLNIQDEPPKSKRPRHC